MPLRSGGREGGGRAVVPVSAVTQPCRLVSQCPLPAPFRRQVSKRGAWLGRQPRPAPLSCRASSAERFGSLRGFLRTPRPRAPRGNRCRLRQAPPLDQVNPLQELYILQKKKTTPQPSWSSGIQPVARCMCPPGLTSGCSLENRSLPPKCRILWLLFSREGSHTLGGLKCAVLSKN